MSTGGSSTFQMFQDDQWVWDTFASYWLKLNWLGGYQPNLAVVLLIVAVAVYSAWYYLLVVNKPRVVGGGTSLKEHVLTHCPILSQYYYPTFWACGCHFTTIGRAKLQKCPGVMYDREILTMNDGGRLALDWLADLPPQCDKDDAPILLFLSGITGSSFDNYVKYCMLDGMHHGYRPVVMNYRGCGGVSLVTARVYSGTDIEDLFTVTHRIHALYPKASIVGMGVSLGGVILTQYCHQLGKECNLKAAISIGACLDPFVTKESLENRLINRHVYSTYLIDQLRDLVITNKAILTQEQISELPVDMDYVLKARTLSEFDERLTVPLFGYATVNDYYKAARNSDKLHKISIPYICLTSTDDPFVPKKSIPYQEFERNPHTLLITTSRGGHFGYLEGIWPTKQTWMNRVNRELLSALKHYDYIDSH